MRPVPMASSRAGPPRALLFKECDGVRLIAAWFVVVDLCGVLVEKLVIGSSVTMTPVKP